MEEEDYSNKANGNRNEQMLLSQEERQFYLIFDKKER